MKANPQFESASIPSGLREAYRLSPDVQFGVAILMLLGALGAGFRAAFRFMGEVGREWK